MLLSLARAARNIGLRRLARWLRDVERELKFPHVERERRARQSEPRRFTVIEMGGA